MGRYCLIAPTIALCALFLLGGCQDKKVAQENVQLKAQVLDLQKQLGDMGNRVEELTKARDDLTKQNAALTVQINRLKGKRGTRPAKAKKRRNRAA
jgi:peptidoglycan hydrolase CwlO-like protein